MKKKFLLITSILAALLIISCGKKTESANSAAAGEPVAEMAAQEHMVPGFIIVRNTGFYVMVGEDTGEEKDLMKWVTALALGEKVFVGESRKATYDYDKEVYTYTKIRRTNGDEGYVTSLRVVPGNYLAVVTDERATQFRSPNAIDVSNTILTRKTVVVCYPETESGGFIKVAGFDPWQPNGGRYIPDTNNYVRATALSRSDADIQSSILWQTAVALNATTEKVRRDTLLDMAITTYPASVFYSEILAEANPGSSAGGDIGPITRPTTLKVNDDNVNVRDQAGTNGRVVGYLHSGDTVTVTERTSQTFEINGQTSYWYKISSPVNGWVFGAFLTN
jgi:hypothetical protein